MKTNVTYSRLKVFLYLQTLETLASQSDVVIKGKIISIHNYKRNELIYTANRVEVYNSISTVGSISPTTDTVFIVTQGGVYESEYQSVRWVFKYQNFG